MKADTIIGRRAFTDGTTRDVFEDADGQYVLGDDGRKVRGVLLLTDQDDEADVPVIVGLTTHSGYSPASNRDSSPCVGSIQRGPS